jgi:hypothetical protein
MVTNAIIAVGVITVVGISAAVEVAYRRWRKRRQQHRMMDFDDDAHRVLFENRWDFYE